MENRNEMEFDLVQLIRHLFRRCWIILLAAAILAGIANYISESRLVPTYTSHCRIYVYRDPQSDKGVDYNGLLLANQMANDCKVLITGVNVSQKVVEELGMNVSPSYISNGLAVTSQDNTRILQIDYTDTDPNRAVAVLDKVCEIAAKEIQNTMKVESVSVIYGAQSPTGPNPNSVQRDTLLAGAVGAALAIAVLVVLFLLDDTMRNEDDVERFLGLSTLSAIPICDELNPGGKPNDSSKGKLLARIKKK